MKKSCLSAVLVGFMAVSQYAGAVNVYTEEQLRIALDNIGTDPSIHIQSYIDLTSELTMPIGSYSIYGYNHRITTYDGSELAIPANVKIQNLIINDDTTYILNNRDYGGAIYNYNGADYNIYNNGVFKNNSANYEGGAIYNYINNFSIENNAEFSGNAANSLGGSVSNYYTNFTIGNNAEFSNNYSGYDGGVAYNYSSNFTIGNNAVFSNNTANNSGGALFNDYNNNLKIKNDAVFSNNAANNGDGGAVYNGAGATLIIGNNATFSGNSSKNEGGAVFNYDADFTIGNNATFSGNTINGVGGAVFNYYTHFTIGNNAEFSNNYSGYDGGVVYNYSSNFTVGNDAVFSGNTANNSGGALFNDYNNTFIIEHDAVFYNNTANNGDGGAVRNYITDFTIGNNAEFSGNKAGNYGGAVYNISGSTLKIGNNATFSGNTANSLGGAIFNDNNSIVRIENNAIFSNNSSNGLGGAVYNEDYSNFILNDGGIFENNTANYNGGAIYNHNATTTLIAYTNNVEFTGNKANGISNAINNAYGSILNLNASDTASIIFNDRITSKSDNNYININANSNIRPDMPTTGTIYLNEDMSGFGNYSGTENNAVRLYGGTLALGSGGIFFTTPDFYAAEGSMLDLLNGQIDNIMFRYTNIDNMLLKLDVDMASALSDNLVADFLYVNKTILLSEISVLNDLYEEMTFTISEPGQFELLLAEGAMAYGSTYNYNILNNNNGTITLSPFSTVPAPEPTSMLLGLLALSGVTALRRKKAKA